MQAVITDIDRQGDTGRKYGCFISVPDPDRGLEHLGPLDPELLKGLIQISDMDLVGFALIWVRGSGSRGIK